MTRSLFPDDDQSEVAATAARTFPHVVIRASAGTGKTFQLSNRFLGLACNSARPDHVLAATFARKAAGEILDRVLIRLAEAASNPQKLRELATHLEEPTLDQPRCQSLLKTLTSQLHRLRIGTLDSFFIQLAGNYGLELGLPPGWGIVDELVDRRLRADAIQRVLQGESTADLVTLMHLLSKGEVKRSVSEQITEVVNELYDLYCQTSRDAWHALPRYTPLNSDELTIAVAAFEALPPFTNKNYANAHARSLECLRQQDWEGFISGGMGAAVASGTNQYYKKPLDPDVIAAYQPLVEHARAELIARVGHQTEATWRLLDRFDKEYQKLKHEQRALRFDDVTRRLAERLNGLAADQLGYRLDAHISHLLLDEFQDTSLQQWSVLRRFARTVTTSGPDRSFFCVGDVKQAIYGWRGGVSEIFDAVGEELEGLTQQPLDRSFRSSQTVIDTVNEVFGALAKCPPLDKYAEVTSAWRTRFTAHSTARGELPGYCRLETGPRPPDGSSKSGSMLSFAAEEVARLAAECPGKSIGVLVRRNRGVAQLIYELRSKGILASEEGGNPLTDSAAVQLILSLVSIADHPGSTVARFHVATSPLGEALGFTDFQDNRAAQRLSLAIRDSLLNAGYGRTLYGWVRALAPACDERELSRLLQFVELAYEYDHQATVRADDFIDYIELRKVEDPAPSNVRVMTVHQSKGLQFDIVILPELEGRLTGQPRRVVVGRNRAIDPIDRVCRYTNEKVQALLPKEFQRLFETAPNLQVNESLCVLYVAMTRAVHALHMIIPPASESEKNIPGTYAGVLRSTLAPDEKADPRKILFEAGDANWFAKSASQAGTASSVPETEHLTIRLAPPKNDHRGLDRQTPSSLEGGTRISLARRLRLDNARALSRGTVLHAWFEQIAWLEDGLPAEAELEKLAHQHGEHDFPALRRAFERMLKQPALRELLSQAPYRKSLAARLPAAADLLASGKAQLRLFREHPFAVREGRTLVQGTIDRLIVVRNGTRPLAAEIIDFKSDAIPAGDEAALEATVENYRPQLDAYRRAVARTTGPDLTQVTAQLLFVEQGLVRAV